MRDRRRLRLVVAALTALVGSVVVIAQAAAMVMSAAIDGPPAGSMFEITDDDAGVALFTVAGLEPARPVVNCIAVAHHVVSGEDALRLALSGAVAGGLAPHLAFRVEAGKGAAFGNCETFEGSVVYDGTLTDFATSGVATDVAEREGVTAYRFTTMLASDNAAQGQTAEATFTWEAVAVPAPVPTPTSTPVATPAPTPAVTVPTDEVPAPAAPGSEATAAPTPAPATQRADRPAAPSVTAPAPAQVPTITEAPGAPSAGTSTAVPTAPRAGRRAQVPGAVLEPIEDAPTFAAQAAAVAAEVAKKGSFPAILLLILFAFLTLQDLIDRRDPKLALAPVHAEPDVTFLDPAAVR